MLLNLPFTSWLTLANMIIISLAIPLGNPGLAQNNTSHKGLLLDVEEGLESREKQLNDDSFAGIYDFLLISGTAIDQSPVHQYLEQGRTQLTQGRFHEAILSFQAAIDIYKAIGNLGSTVDALWGLGVAYTNVGEYQRAVSIHQEQLEIAQNIQYTWGESRALGSIGNAYFRLGQYQQAIHYLEQQLMIAKDSGEYQAEGRAFGNLGLVYFSLGQYEKAIEYVEKHLEITQEIGDHQGQGRALGNLGAIFFQIGKIDQAINYFEQHLRISQEIGNSSDEGNALANLGTAYKFLVQYERAINYFEQALAITRETGALYTEGVVLGNLGNTYGSLGQYQKAMDLIGERLEIAQAIDDQVGESAAYSSFGHIYSSLRRHQRAIEEHQKSLAINQEIGDRYGEGLDYNNIGINHQALNQASQAIQAWQETIQIWESLRTEEMSDVNHLSLLDKQLITYKYLQYALATYGKPKAALEIAERSRAQALKLQLLRVLSEEQSVPWEKHINIERIQQIAADQVATLVSYTVLRNGEVLIWAIQPDGTITFRRSASVASIEDLEVFVNLWGDRGPNSTPTQLQELVQTIRGNGAIVDRQQLGVSLERLYEVLIEPISDVLPTDENDLVIFIPHQELFQVPFAALRNPDTKEYLIENYTISTAPSILSLALTKERQTQIQGVGQGALIVGNPELSDALKDEPFNLEDLPGAEAEALAIASLLETDSEDVLLKEAATKAAVIDRIHEAKYVHLATHGLLLDTPAYSTIPGLLALAPSPDDERGELTAQEIVELTQTEKLVADLVVLSACRTGQGQITSDGAYGLSRAFLTGGTPSLIVSLWDANDDATQFLMTEFYSHLLGADSREPLGKAQSLRQAMLATIEEYPDPKNWAAFTLIGQPD